MNDCYLVAGSFTGFLIRTYGWDQYRQFYRLRKQQFLTNFKKCFEVSLEEAGLRWRHEMMATQPNAGTVIDLSTE